VIPSTSSSGTLCAARWSAAISSMRSPQASRPRWRSSATSSLEPKPGGKPRERQIKSTELPNTDFVDMGVRGDLSEFADTVFTDRDTFAGDIKQGKFVEQIATVLARQMDLDDSVVIMGEDVHRLNGGNQRRHPRYPRQVARSHHRYAHQRERLHRSGRRDGPRWPLQAIVEFMYADFMWVAADQLFNQIGKARHMFGGDQRRAVRPAQQCRHGHRLRLTALHGPRRRVRHAAGMAHRRPIDPRSTTSAS